MTNELRQNHAMDTYISMAITGIDHDYMIRRYQFFAHKLKKIESKIHTIIPPMLALQGELLDKIPEDIVIFDKDHHALTQSDILIAFVDQASSGVAIEITLAIIKFGIPVIVLTKVDYKISPFLTGFLKSKQYQSYAHIYLFENSFDESEIFVGKQIKEIIRKERVLRDVL